MTDILGRLEAAQPLSQEDRDVAALTIMQLRAIVREARELIEELDTHQPKEGWGNRLRRRLNRWHIATQLTQSLGYTGEPSHETATLLSHR